MAPDPIGTCQLPVKPSEWPKILAASEITHDQSWFKLIENQLLSNI